MNKDLLVRFEELVDTYFSSGEAQRHGTPTVAWCASRLCLSANYFGDLIKKEIGITAQEYIRQKTMDVAKDRLADPRQSISEIAYYLGYQYPQYFSRAFKKAVGTTPVDYRRTLLDSKAKTPVITAFIQLVFILLLIVIL